MSFSPTQYRETDYRQGDVVDRHGLRGPDYVGLCCPLSARWLVAVEEKKELAHWSWAGSEGGAKQLRAMGTAYNPMSMAYYSGRDWFRLSHQKTLRPTNQLSAALAGGSPWKIVRLRGMLSTQTAPVGYRQLGHVLAVVTGSSVTRLMDANHGVYAVPTNQLDAWFTSLCASYTAGDIARAGQPRYLIAGIEVSDVTREDEDF